MSPGDGPVDPPTMNDGEIIARLEKENAALLAACEAAHDLLAGAWPDADDDWKVVMFVDDREVVQAQIKAAIDLAKPPDVATEKDALALHAAVEHAKAIATEQQSPAFISQDDDGFAVGEVEYPEGRPYGKALPSGIVEWCHGAEKGE